MRIRIKAAHRGGFLEGQRESGGSAGSPRCYADLQFCCHPDPHFLGQTLSLRMGPELWIQPQSPAPAEPSTVRG
jgi:hypothetical protein